MTRNPNIRLELPYSSGALDLVVSAHNGFRDYDRTSRAKKKLEQNDAYSVGNLTLRLDSGTLHVNFNGRRRRAERLFESLAQFYLYGPYRTIMVMNTSSSTTVN